MPQQGQIYRVMIAAPSDCVAEQHVILDVIRMWNAANSFSTAAIIEPVMWQTHTYPQLGDRPQAIINRQIGECDFLVATFWTRLGTPTGEAQSGTVEEIQSFRDAHKPVLLYFSTVPFAPDNIDTAQLDALRNFKNGIRQEGLVVEYESMADLRIKFEQHLILRMKGFPNRLNVHTDQVPLRESAQSQPSREFRDRLRNLLKHVSARWAAELYSQPSGIDDAKYMLSEASNDIIELRSLISRHESGMIWDDLDEIARRLRVLSRYQLSMDGGRSFREFWKLSTETVNLLSELSRSVEGS